MATDFVRLLAAPPWRLDAAEILRLSRAASFEGRPVHEAAAEALRTRLTGIRKRPGAPSTSRASEIGARFGALPDPSIHPNPPLT